MKVARIVASALLLVLLLACAPKAAPTPPVPVPQAPAAAPVTAKPAAPAKPTWEIEWERTLAAAKNEGRLVLYTALGGAQRQIVTNPFVSKYGVRVEPMTGSGPELITRILAEQRAGIYSGDVHISGTSPYITLKDKGALDSPESLLILPELTQPELIKKTWYFGEVPWADKAHTTLIGLMVFQEIILV